MSDRIQYLAAVVVICCLLSLILYSLHAPAWSYLLAAALSAWLPK